MTKVDINAGGRQIIVEHENGDPIALAEQAMKLWRQTDALPPPPGPAVGFAAVERGRTIDQPYGRTSRLEVDA